MDVRGVGNLDERGVVMFDERGVKLQEEIQYSDPLLRQK